jgi:hypothetical protein
MKKIICAAAGLFLTLFCMHAPAFGYNLNSFGMAYKYSAAGGVSFSGISADYQSYNDFYFYKLSGNYNQSSNYIYYTYRGDLGKLIKIHPYDYFKFYGGMGHTNVEGFDYSFLNAGIADYWYIRRHFRLGLGGYIFMTPLDNFYGNINADGFKLDVPINYKVSSHLIIAVKPFYKYINSINLKIEGIDLGFGYIF